MIPVCINYLTDDGEYEKRTMESKLFIIAQKVAGTQIRANIEKWLGSR